MVGANELSGANETYFIATFSGDTPVATDPDEHFAGLSTIKCGPDKGGSIAASGAAS